MAYNWPGNVREMENVLQQTLLLSPFVVILPENLPEHFQQQRENKEGVALPDISPLEAAERDQIRQTLKETSWNQSKTAQLLGIDRKTLRLKIRRYGLFDEKLSTDGISSAER
jgi:two-component system response regulator HydG